MGKQCLKGRLTLPVIKITLDETLQENLIGSKSLAIKKGAGAQMEKDFNSCESGLFKKQK